MSRTRSKNWRYNPEHPYWRFGVWQSHGPKFVRTFLHKRMRRQTRQAIHHDREPPRRPMAAAWIWW